MNGRALTPSGVSGGTRRGIVTLVQDESEVAGLRKFSCCRFVAISLLLILQSSCSMVRAQTNETIPLFELDCVNFEGRFLAKAPAKKKARPGLAVDGTAWALSADNKKVYITRIFEGEAAGQAGLKAGDEIVSVNGYPAAGLEVRDLICAYHMYDLATLTETLSVRKQDGTEQTLKLQLLTPDKCNPEEKRAWLDIYKGLGY